MHLSSYFPPPSVPMTRTRSRTDKDKELPPHTGAQPHWSMAGGHGSGAVGGIDYHRSGQTRQGNNRWYVNKCN